MSRMGSRTSAAVRETILVHEEMEYMGTLSTGQCCTISSRIWASHTSAGCGPRIVVGAASGSSCCVAAVSKRSSEGLRCARMVPYVCSHIDLFHQAGQHFESQRRVDQKKGETAPYTMDNSVAARDATPAMTVAAASNFCPVPPIFYLSAASRHEIARTRFVQETAHQAAP